jgi:hypothetical protein
LDRRGVVGRERIQPEPHFFAVGHSVTVAVKIQRIRLELDLLSIHKSYIFHP